MTCALLDTVCREHAITKKMFYEQNSILVREAHDAFIRRAYCEYQWHPDEIARVLQWDAKKLKFTIDKVIGRSNAGASPAGTEQTAGPFSFDKKELHTGPAVAPPYHAPLPQSAIVGCLWGRPEKNTGAHA